MNTEKLNQFCQAAYSFPQTVYHSYNTALKVVNESIEGDLVECGVAAGSQIAAFQLALMETGATDRRIWAFDSFEGIPLAGEFDTEQPGIGEIKTDKFAPIEQRLVSSGVTAHSLESVVNNFNGWGLPTANVEFVKGWFQHTLKSTVEQMGKISVLRLDGDLYESTLICLKYLYPKVSKGGIVIIDDYALAGCQAAVKQYFKSIRKKFPEMETVDGYGVVCFTKP
jgi:hypothetical protein